MPILTWLTRDNDIQQATRAPYRLLEPVPELSHGESDTENMLIHGDNLDALKALLPYYAGQVKCVYIDPPYNTLSAFEQYDDNLEHSKWLSLLYPRLEILRDLLAEDGSIWISIDDNEAHYLKVIMDEIFGRNNFVASLIWEKADSPRNSARQFSVDHDYILVYSKNPNWMPNKLPRTEAANSIYSNPDNDLRGAWLPGDPYANKPYSKGLYTIVGPTGREFSPPPGRYWRVSEEKLRELDEDGRIWWGPTQNARPSIKRYLSEVSDLVPRTLWNKEDVGSNRTSKNEMRNLFPGIASFDTPKPERLLERIIHISANPGDLILDSFAGSGTTGAVAHKMGCKWIMVELGYHCETHIVPRMQKVIDGEQGGISQALNWQGGGGFKFYRLGEPVFDENGRIQPAIKFPTLAAHVWFTETNQPYQGVANSPLLGMRGDTAIALLYNGILGDKRVNGGNVLTHKLLAELRAQAPRLDGGPMIIYGECSRISPERLQEENITFKQTPYDIKVR